MELDWDLEDQGSNPTLDMKLSGCLSASPTVVHHMFVVQTARVEELNLSRVGQFHKLITYQEKKIFLSVLILPTFNFAELGGIH